MFFLLGLAGSAYVLLNEVVDDEPEERETYEGTPSDQIDVSENETNAITLDEPVSHYQSGDPGGFNIDLNFKGDWTAKEQEAFVNAAEFLSDVILEDVENSYYDGKPVDDLTIDVSKEAIDGSSKVLGYAEVDAIRHNSKLPTAANIVMDRADIAYQMTRGIWESTALHEMIHALGFGITWGVQGLIDNSNADAGPRFNGHNATAMYQYGYDAAKDDPHADLGVPIHLEKGGHWDEGVFDEEVMITFIDRDNTLSVMTLAALEDMGYDTVLDDITRTNDRVGQIPNLPFA